jgi:hypothetical protein
VNTALPAAALAPLEDDEDPEPAALDGLVAEALPLVF